MTRCSGGCSGAADGHDDYISGFVPASATSSWKLIEIVLQISSHKNLKTSKNDGLLYCWSFSNQLVQNWSPSSASREMTSGARSARNETSAILAFSLLLRECRLWSSRLTWLLPSMKKCEFTRRPGHWRWTSLEHAKDQRVGTRWWLATGSWSTRCSADRIVSYFWSLKASAVYTKRHCARLYKNVCVYARVNRVA